MANNLNQFKAFVRKEMYHILRDKWTMVILLALPNIMMILFGFAISTEVKNTRIAVFDGSHDPSTLQITERLRSNTYFTLAYELDSFDSIEGYFQRGEIGLAVVFSDRFHQEMITSGEAQVLLIADGIDPNIATTIVNYATSIIAAYQLEQSGLTGIPFQIVPEVKLLYNPTMKAAYNFVPGVMGMILMLICAMMTSISIAREKELGTMEVLLVSPMRPILIILSKTVPYFLISIINLTTILILSIFVLDVPVAGSWVGLMGVSLLFIFVSLALGILISSVVKTQMVALLISGLALMMPVILLSGMMFPIENMPLLLRMISEVIPARWYIAAVKKVMIKGLDVFQIWKELLILGTMAVVLLTVSLKNFKTRLE